MEFVGLVIIVIILCMIYEAFKKVVLYLRDLCNKWRTRKSRYQRRKERYNQIMERQKDRFLFYMEIHKPIPQKKKEKRQKVVYRGHFAKEAKETEDLKK